jgi:hypothetical protein
MMDAKLRLDSVNVLAQKVKMYQWTSRSTE